MRPTLEQMETRLVQEQARAAHDYDDARAQLGEHHQAMSSQQDSLEAKIEALRPTVEGVLHGEALTPEAARACLRYLDLNAKLHRTRQARRLSFPATQEPGEERMGGAMGDPLEGLPSGPATKEE